MMLAARLRAIIRQRCPVCLQGAMFRGRFEMNATCPVCGHRFEREPGFFQGAMYVSYGIGIVYIGVLAILANAFLVPHIDVVPAAGCIVAIHLACVPRSEEHTSELQSLITISYAVFCLKKKKKK